MFTGLHKNVNNSEVVSHKELRGILGQFEHSIIGSVKASVLDAMKQREAQKKRERSPEPGPSHAYELISDSESEEEPADTLESDIEDW